MVKTPSYIWAKGHHGRVLQAARREGRGLHLREFVTHTAHGLDVVGIPRIGFYFSPNISDVHVRCADLTVKISIPKLLHNLLSAVDPPGMGCKETKNLELCSGQIDA